jgi:hypothetical protein
MARRIFFLVALALFTPIHNASADNERSLFNVGEQLESAAKAVEQFVNSIMRLVQSGVATYDLFAARRAHSWLLDYAARASRLYEGNVAIIIPAFDEYLASPSDEKWIIVQKEIAQPLSITKDLLHDLQADRSDFVAEDSYRDLGLVLQQRGVVLEKILTLPPPRSQGELKALKTIRDKYRLLVITLGEAEAALNLYIKQSSSKTATPN